jgi:hypothetical protein
MALSVKDGIPVQICKTVSYSLQLTPVPRSTKYGNAASKKVKNIDRRSRIAFLK